MVRMYLSALIHASAGVSTVLGYMSPWSYVIPVGEVNGTARAHTAVGSGAFDALHVRLENGDS